MTKTANVAKRGLAHFMASLLEGWVRKAFEPVGATRVSWIGSFAGVLGALLLALNMTWSGLGWFAFLASNFAWIIYAVLQRVPSLLVMQLVFTSTSLIGIFRWSV